VPDERVRALTIGAHPEAAVSGGLLLQSEDPVSLLVNAMADERTSRGVLERVGIAVLEFTGCFLTRFGSPNDEGRPARCARTHAAQARRSN
jgi:hypothetical protein